MQAPLMINARISWHCLTDAMIVVRHGGIALAPVKQYHTP